MKYDFLLVGQGIAGSVLGFTLLNRGYKIMVVDNGEPTTSSKVAAGIFNPITGRKMVKTWMADTLFSHLHQFYPVLEQKVEVSFFHPTPLYFPFDSQEKQNYWLAESAAPEFQSYVSHFEKQGFEGGRLHDTYGGMVVRQGGYVDIPVMLHAARQFFISKKIYLQAQVSFEDLNIKSDSVSWKGIEARKMVFCDGGQAAQNPWFRWLPFRPVKGELLHVALEAAPFTHIVNRGCWILPHHDGLHRVGATYDNRDHSLDTTSKAREQLLNKLTALTNVRFQIMKQQAGIRPATYDRRPFLGNHPLHPSVSVFNGLGTKGISLAPYFAEKMADYLETQSPLPPEIDIARIPDKYRGSIQ